ncbi:MAG TPA: hypothetical protein VFW82_12780 [Dyella sp.]|nr:hypothetical protein [Dyella sp.]
MSHLHTDQLRKDLGLIHGDIARLLHDAADDAGVLAQDARTRLEALRQRVALLERETADRARRRAAWARERARARPWVVVGTIAAGAFLLGRLGCDRDE